MSLPLTIMSALIYLAVPAGILALGTRIKLIRKVNPVIICYLLGILIGNVGILPEGFDALQDQLSSVVVALSIPLLLFSVNISRWSRTSIRAVAALGLAAIAVAIASSVGHLLFGRFIPESPRIAGMMVGLYTGGTPNLAAISTALDVPSEPYLAVLASDTILGGVYLLFVITIAKPLLSRVLKPFQNDGPAALEEIDPMTTTRFGDVVRKPYRLQSLAAFGLSVLLVGISLGISMLVPPDWETVVILLSLTTLAIAASLVSRVRELKTSFRMAEYLVLVFCLVVGSMANVERLLNTPVQLLGFVTLTLFGSLLLHIVLCKIAGIDVDTMIVTSTAAICSPPFVGMAAVAIRNRAVISAGITAGIIGYAAGNYLGVFMALVLERL
ncbi:MAG: DUF819 family protein [Spirochaetales bacterium]|nr:DUF819 family protein [Spirochaetales bacterium]